MFKIYKCLREVFRKLYSSVSVILLVFPLVFFSGCFSIKSVHVGKVQNLQLDNFTTKDITFSVYADIKNPNNFCFTISKVKLKVSLEGKELGKVVKINKIIVQKKSDTLHEIKVTIDLNEQSTGMSGLFKLYQKRNAMRFNGFIKVRSFLISKKIKVEDKNLFQLLNY